MVEAFWIFIRTDRICQHVSWKESYLISSKTPGTWNNKANVPWIIKAALNKLSTIKDGPFKDSSRFLRLHGHMP
jgi:hypothetical protein